MNKRLFLLALLSPLALLGTEIEVPHLTAYGKAEIRVTPDTMVWHLSLETVDGDIEDAAEKHWEELEEVMDYLRDSDIPEEHLQTSRMQLQENWEHRKGEREMAGYIARTTVFFKSGDFDDYVDHWKKLSRFESVRINEVRFELSNEATVRRKALEDALKNATDKAMEMAHIMDVALAHPYLIEEIPPEGGYPRPVHSMEMRAFSGSSDAIAPGSVSVQARAKVIFQIDKPARP